MKDYNNYKNLLRMYKIKLMLLENEPVDKEMIILCNKIINLLKSRIPDNDKVLKKKIKVIKKMTENLEKIKNQEKTNEKALKLKKGKKRNG